MCQFYSRIPDLFLEVIHSLLQHFQWESHVELF
jgi:hypothetical protein